MKAFTYQMPVQVYFGEHSVQNYLEKELRNYGPNIMIAYGKGAIKRIGLYDELMAILKNNNKNVVELTDIPANPTYEKVLEGIDLYRKNNIDLILACGGGSVVDCVKTISAGIYEEDDLWDAQINQKRIAEKMGNYAVILTLSGAGAEMDAVGAVTKEDINAKNTFIGSYAKFVIIDPNYQKDIPLQSFIPGVFDSLTHCMETYFGNGYGVSDRMNEGLMKDIIVNMKELVSGNDTLDIRSNLMWDSSLVQTFLFNVGTDKDFQGHRIENTLGAYSHGTHGKQLAVILPAYYRKVYQSQIDKFAMFARNVFGIECDDDKEAATLGLDALDQLVKDAKLPRTFSECGYELTDEVAKEVSEKCAIVTTGPRVMTRNEIYQLLVSLK